MGYFVIIAGILFFCFLRYRTYQREKSVQEKINTGEWFSKEVDGINIDRNWIRTTIDTFLEKAAPPGFGSSDFF